MQILFFMLLCWSINIQAGKPQQKSPRYVPEDTESFTLVCTCKTNKLLARRSKLAKNAHKCLALPPYTRPPLCDIKKNKSPVFRDAPNSPGAKFMQDLRSMTDLVKQTAHIPLEIFLALLKSRS